MLDFDAVVVGGGPAGSTIARLLARRGWRVALAEGRQRHRAKACGDCLNPRASRLLHRAGLLEEVRRLAAGSTRWLRVHMEGRPAVLAPLPPGENGPGLLVQRDKFDQFLIDEAATAGAHVFQPASVRIRSFGPGGAIMRLVGDDGPMSLSTRLVVGADGLRSAVARDSGLGGRRVSGGKFGFALEVPWRGAGITDDTIEMFVVPGGYIGVVGLDCGLLHVAGLVSPTARSSRNPYRFVASVARRFSELRDAGLDRLEESCSGPLLGAGPMPCRPRRLANEWVALVGDAAGYAEPFTGEGMSWALESAELLGESIDDERRWTIAAARRYQNAWKRTIGRRQRLCRLLVGGIARSAMSRSIHGAAVRHPALAAWLIRRALS